MLQVGKQAYVRIWERRSRTSLEVFDRLRKVRAADDVQPLLHVALVRELRLRPPALSLEEGVQVELVELASVRDGEQFVWHLVREQPHLRKCAVRVPLVRVLGGITRLGALLVGVGPVEDLLLNKLSSRQRLEWRPR